MSHSPLPWTDELTPAIAAYDDRVIVNGSPLPVPSRILAEGNFQRAKTAVNSLPALVKALEDIANVSAGGPHVSDDDAMMATLSALCLCRDIARAALASHKTGAA